mgnify:CR=1 FL=1
MSRADWVEAGILVSVCLTGPACMVFWLAVVISFLATILFALCHAWPQVLIGAEVCVVGVIGFWFLGRVFIRLFNRLDRILTLPRNF